jgi:hypothetical protein
MFVILNGSPAEGFEIIGPYAELPEGGAYDLGFPDAWEFQLDPPREPCTISELKAPWGYDPNGTAVVWGGAITEPFVIYGPFRNIEAARQWAFAEELGVDCAIPLTPVPSQKKVA